MKDLLPLIIGLVWLGFTLYNKDRKAKARKTDSTTERKPSLMEQILMGEQFEDILEDNFEDFETSEDNLSIEGMSGDEFDVAGTVEERKGTVETDETPFLKHELARFINKDNREDRRNGEFYIEIDEIKEERRMQNMEFDLKKAVIYSEILNAPYI